MYVQEDPQIMSECLTLVCWVVVGVGVSLRVCERGASFLCLKGLCQEMTFLWKALRLNQYATLFMGVDDVLNVKAALLKRKINRKIFIASMKTLTNSQYSQSRIRIYDLAFFLCHRSLFSNVQC